MCLSDRQFDKIVDELSKSKSSYDPYRPFLHYITGIIGFSLGIIVAVLAALPEDTRNFPSNISTMMGGILAWMSITAVVATLVSLAIQFCKSRSVGLNSGFVAIICAIPALTGLMAVYFAVIGGASMVKVKGDLSDVFGTFGALLPY